MKIIAHRGNMNGPSKYENTNKAIRMAIDAGFDIEIDVIENKEPGIWLGHDEPQELLDIKLLNYNKNRIWVHVKSPSLIKELKIIGANYFWHENDLLTLTSHKYQWCLNKYYPNEKQNDLIAVVLNGPPSTVDNYSGICTDYCYEWKYYLESQ